MQCASVVGVAFTPSQLEAVLPPEYGPLHFAVILAHLCDAGLLDVPTEPGGTHRFHQVEDST